MTKFWIFVFALFLVFFQVSFSSKSEKSLTGTAKDDSKNELKIATGNGKISNKHKSKKHKHKHKHKHKKKSKRPKISDGELESTEKEKSNEALRLW